MESYEILWKTTLPEIENTVSYISFETHIKPFVPVNPRKQTYCMHGKSTFRRQRAGSFTPRDYSRAHEKQFRSERF